MAEAGKKEAKPAAPPADGGEGEEAPPKKSRLKTMLILTILVMVLAGAGVAVGVINRKSTRLNSSHSQQSRMPSSA